MRNINKLFTNKEIERTTFKVIKALNKLEQTQQQRIKEINKIINKVRC